ncbi:MAG: DNA polymerase III subunit gamma/tau [Cytophagales bacterium]|nr:DNA polymerase III subunit gamma/tau [Cytophagales bacterium]
MENFVVSARKYRPSTFGTVVGQKHITTTLKNAIQNNHLAQAFLFCGPRGVGKTTNARILAKTINCEQLTENIEPCNECNSCKNFNENKSFNVHELDAASNNSVEDIRSLVEQVRYAPQTGKYKIYIIDEVHMLSNAAFNAFLKTLEEPPSYAIFILATTEKHKIIPTILSRCQIFDFNRIQVQDMKEHLQHIAQQEKIEAEEEALNLIAQKADGALRDALSMFDLMVTFSSDGAIRYQNVIDNLHILDYDYYFKVVEHFLNEEMAQVLVLFDEILKKGFDGHHFIIGLAEHLRNLMVCKDKITIDLLEVSEQVKERYREQAEKCTESFLLSSLSVCGKCDQEYKQSKNQRLHVELALMKLSHIQQVLQLSQQPLPKLVAEQKNTRLENTSVSPAPKQSTTTKTTESAANPKPVAPKTISTGFKSTKVEPKPVQKVSSPRPAPSSNTTTPSNSQTQSKPFTFEDLKYYWKQYILEQENLKPNSTKVLNQEIKCNGNIITLWVKEQNDIAAVNSQKDNLLRYLQKSLKNNQLMLMTKVKQKITKSNSLSRSKTFELLRQQNPLIERLADDLGLDINNH